MSQYKETKRALLIIDVQNDFLPGGSLAVDDGFAIIPVINNVHKSVRWDMVILSQDWHPRGHMSFSSSWAGKLDIKGQPIVPGKIHVTNARGPEEVLWPDHCVQGSHGAQFHQDLFIAGSDFIVKKGTNPQVDSYSAFADNSQKDLTELYQLLDARQIVDVYVCGIATDYCVNFTCRDARVRKDAHQFPGKNPFNTYLIVDACRGVDQAGSAKAVQELQSQFSVHVTTSNDLIRNLSEGGPTTHPSNDVWTPQELLAWTQREGIEKFYNNFVNYGINKKQLLELKALLNSNQNVLGFFKDYFNPTPGELLSLTAAIRKLN